MNEIIVIIYLFFIFSLFCLAPLNIFKNNILNFSYSRKNSFYFNLIINLNILLLLSLLPIQLTDYSFIIIIILILICIKNYLFLMKVFKDINLNIPNILFLIAVFFILSIEVASELNLGWDAKWFWYIKSLYYTQNQTFNELSNYVYNDFHPHLGSFIWAFYRDLSINGYEYNGRLFYVFFYIISLFFISKNIFRNKTKNNILFIFLIILTQKYIYFSGLQEILIFTILVFMSKFFYFYVKEKNFIDFIFIFLCMNLLIWIKAEGIAYAFICLLTINFISRLNLKKKLIINLLFLSIIFFKILIYKLFQIKINDQPYYFEYIINLDIQTLLYKIKNILIYLSYYSFKNIILISVPIISIINYKKIYENEYFRLMIIFFLVNIMFIFSIYIFRDMDVIYSLKTTIDRIIFSSSGFYLLFVINQFKKN